MFSVCKESEIDIEMHNMNFKDGSVLLVFSLSFCKEAEQVLI